MTLTLIENEVKVKGQYLSYYMHYSGHYVNVKSLHVRTFFCFVFVGLGTTTSGEHQINKIWYRDFLSDSGQADQVNSNAT